MTDFSDYIVFVDESGDQSLDSISREYPIFVLAFCIIVKKHYYEYIVPRVEKLKFDTFGTDIPIFHEREIRKQRGFFKPLIDDALRAKFFTELNDIMDQSKYEIITSIIDKRKYVHLPKPRNVYSLAVEFGIERVFLSMQEKKQRGKKVPIIFESRGKAEDRTLQQEFDRIVDECSYSGINGMFDFHCVSKQANLAGLQFADLIARPIGIHYLHNTKNDTSYNILRKKFRRSREGNILHYGVKVYPE